MSTDQRSRTILVLVATLSVALVGVAVALALRSPARLDPATPEGAAQGFFQAVLDGDEDAALGYVTETLARRCGTGGMRYAAPDDASVVIMHSTVAGGTAELEVEITETRGAGPFGIGTDAFDETVVLERHGDRWLISQVPWPLSYYCWDGGR